MDGHHCILRASNGHLEVVNALLSTDGIDDQSSQTRMEDTTVYCVLYGNWKWSDAPVPTRFGHRRC